MSTVTYIPVGDGSYLLTQDREDLLRSDISTPPIEKKINGNTVIFPYDPVTGGTWIGIAEDHRAACLLSNGSENNKPAVKPEGPHVIAELFGFPDVRTFCMKVNFAKHRPFTLIVIEKRKMYELKLEAGKLPEKEHDPMKPAYFSSVKYLSSKQLLERKVGFDHWISNNPDPAVDDVLALHDSYCIDKNEPIRLSNGIDLLMTVSVTAVHRTDKFIEMIYIDRINEFRFTKKLRLKKSDVAA